MSELGEPRLTYALAAAAVAAVGSCAFARLIAGVRWVLGLGRRAAEPGRRATLEEVAMTECIRPYLPTDAPAVVGLLNEIGFPVLLDHALGIGEHLMQERGEFALLRRAADVHIG